MDLISKFFGIISPILYGIIIAYLLSPIQNFFENKVFAFKSEKQWVKNTRRGLSVFVTVVILLLILAAVLGIFVPGIATSVDNLSGKLDGYVEDLDENLDAYIDAHIDKDGIFGKMYEHIKETLQVDEDHTLFSQLIKKFTDWVSGMLSTENLQKIFAIGSSVLGVLVDFVVTLIFTVYLLISKERQAARMKKLANAFFKKERVARLYNIAEMTDDKVGRYLRMQVLDSICVGLVSYVVYVIFSIPYAPLLALISGVTNIIPYFGPFIGGIPNGIFVLLAEPEKLLPFIIIVLVIQQIDGNIIVPIIQSNNMKLDTFWVLAAIVIMGGIFGFPGMVLGVPVFSVLYVLLKERAEEKLKNKGLATETEAYITMSTGRHTDRPTPPVVRFCRAVRKFFTRKGESTDAPEEQSGNKNGTQEIPETQEESETPEGSDKNASDGEKEPSVAQNADDDCIDNAKAHLSKVHKKHKK